MRIASLTPSATHTLGLLHAQADLVACSHACRPDSRLPRPTSQATDLEPDSLVYQWLVRGNRPASQPLYTLDTDQLAALEPDLIVFSSDLLERDTVHAAADQVTRRTGRPPALLDLQPRTIEDVFDDVLRIGQASGRSPAAEDLAVRLRARMYEAQEYVASFEPRRPVVALLEWTSPLVLAGHWRVQMLERAGGELPWNPTVPAHGAGAAAGPQQAQRRAGPPISASPQSISDTRPDSVVIALPVFSLHQARGLVEPLLREPWFADLPAVRDGHVALVDGRGFHEPGPGLIDSFRWLVGWVQNRPNLLKDLPWQSL